MDSGIEGEWSGLQREAGGSSKTANTTTGGSTCIQMPVLLSI